MQLTRVQYGIALLLVSVCTSLISARSDEANAKAGPETPKGRIVSGRVLTPDGKPAAGAKLFAFVSKRTALGVSEPDEQPRIGETDKEGSFSVLVPEMNRTLVSYLTAYSPGFGIDWLRIDWRKSSEPLRDQTLRLTEDLPITGRVVDHQGSPVAGVTVDIESISDPDGGNLDAYLATWKPLKESTVPSTERFWLGPLSRVVGPTKTNSAGRFSIHGAGKERLIRLSLTGAGIALSRSYVVNRRGFDAKPFNDILRSGRARLAEIQRRVTPADGPDSSSETDPASLLHRRLTFPEIPRSEARVYAPDSSFETELGKVMSGTVKDSATGSPIAACLVILSTELFDGIKARTDDRGNYRIEGIPKKREGYQVTVRPPEGMSYLEQSTRVGDSDGYKPIKNDSSLVKGAVISGRVVDKQTGKGVIAFLRIDSLPENEILETKPEYRPYAANLILGRSTPDGRFRLVAIPGRSVISASARDFESNIALMIPRYRPAEPDPDHKELFHPVLGDRLAINTASNIPVLLSHVNVVKVFNVKESASNTVELTVDPGTTRELVVQDNAGKRLAGARVAGIANIPYSLVRLPEATTSVYTLGPTEERKLVIFHPGRKLGAMLTIRGDKKDAVIAKLEPLGRISGRLVDMDGKPLAGVRVEVIAQDQNLSTLYRDVREEVPQCVADKDGRFTIDIIFPDVSFGLFFRKNKQLYASDGLMYKYKIRPQESLDIGDEKLRLIP
jgi:hypothetical protein